MSKKPILAVGVVLLMAAFGAGYVVGGGGSKSYTIYTGDCYTGAQTVSCYAAGVWWGASGTLAWSDAQGAAHGGVNDPGSWPSCLPPLHEAKGVRFAGAMLPISPNAMEAAIVWVDCR